MKYSEYPWKQLSTVSDYLFNMAVGDFFGNADAKIMAGVENSAPNQCWNWQLTKHGKKGVSMVVTGIQFPNHNKSRPVEVHRFMYLCTFFHINQNNPDSGERVEVSHVCGRSLCVNPDHLSLESTIITCFILIVVLDLGTVTLLIV